MDWERDKSLIARIESMDGHRRFRTGVMAVRRLRAPLLEVAMPEDWGVPLGLLGSLFATLTAEPTPELADAVRRQAAELQQAPLFEPDDMYPEFVEEVQLEALNVLLMLSEDLLGLDVERADYIVYQVRAMTHYVDGVIEDSLRLDPDEEAHQRYLEGLGDDVRAYGLGYFGSRNLEREFACHAAIMEQDSEGDFFASAAGREQVRLCDEFGAELVPVLRRFRSTDFPLS